MIKKIVIVVGLLLVVGCLPASQQEVQTLTAKVSEAIATAEDSIEAIEKVWDTTAGINPYYIYGVGVIGLLKLLRDKKKIGAKYQAHKEGAEKFRVENPDQSATLYNDIGIMRERNGVT